VVTSFNTAKTLFRLNEKTAVHATPLREIFRCTVKSIPPKTIDASGISGPPWSYGVPRLHRTGPAVEGGAAAVRPIVGP